jgi:hypothetical protein
MNKYRIKAMHEVYCDYIVEAENEDAAIEKLCRIEEPWTSYSGGELFGADDALLEHHGIEIDLEESWVSGVCASKRQTHTYPHWEVTEEVSDE